MLKWLLLFLLPLNCLATTWYVSNSGSDSNSGTSSGSPFATLTKVQSVYHSGDIINLAKGSTFTGTLTISGGVLQAYGTGANPIITGFDKITPWVNVGTNLWEATDLNLQSVLGILIIGTGQQAPAFYPKSGYLTYTSGNSTSINAQTAISSVYADGYVAFKKAHYALCSYKITSISGNTINYSGGGGMSPAANYGFFVYNSKAAISAPGDWYYDGAGHIYMYSASAPANVQATRYNNLLTITGNSTIVNGINFVGANQYAISTSARSSLIIESSHIAYCGIGGINNNNLSSSTIQNCFIDSCNNVGILLATYNNVTISNDTISHIGMIPGLGQNIDGAGSNGSYTAIGTCCQTGSVGNVFTGMNVSYTGYNGVTLKGGYTFSNFSIHDVCSVMDDGGALYTDVGTSVVAYSPYRIISNGVVWNAIGSPQGTSNGINQAVGIYCDDNSSEITISNVTSYSNGQYSFFLHNAHNITLSNFIGWNAPAVLAMVKDGIVPTKLYNIQLSNNQFIGTTGTQQPIILKAIAPTSVPADLTNWGTSSNSYYGNTATNNTPFATQLYAQSVVNRTFASWQSTTGQDATSSYITVPPPTIQSPNPSNSILTVPISAQYKDLAGNIYNAPSYTVSAYSGKFTYYYQSQPPLAPSISYSPNTYTFTQNVPISIINVTNTGGAGTFSISPVQPPGLMFSTSTGQLTGTPITPQSATPYTVTCTNITGSSHATITFTVVSVSPSTGKFSVKVGTVKLKN